MHFFRLVKFNTWRNIRACVVVNLSAIIGVWDLFAQCSEDKKVFVIIICILWTCVSFSVSVFGWPEILIYVKCQYLSSKDKGVHWSFVGLPPWLRSLRSLGQMTNYPVFDWYLNCLRNTEIANTVNNTCLDICVFTLILPNVCKIVYDIWKYQVVTYILFLYADVILVSLRVNDAGLEFHEL
jgi:hypothetical protein